MVKESKAAKSTYETKNRSTENQLTQRIENMQHTQIQDSSSTTSTSESSESFRSFYEVEAKQEINYHVVDNIYETDTESILGEEPENVQCSWLQLEDDFFKTFEEIPDVDSISVDISLKSQQLSVHSNVELSLKAQSVPDVGKFVNPLTGSECSAATISSKEITTEAKTLAREEEEEEEEEVEENILYEYKEEEELAKTSDLTLLPADTLLMADDNKSNVMDDTLEIFLQLQKATDTIKTKEFDWMALKRYEDDKKIHDHTIKFLEKLINEVVQTAEYRNPETLLKQNLDKRKLLLELTKKLPTYYFEKNICNFLNRQAVLHFRRKKLFRAIMEDNPKTVFRDREKLQTCKEYLDKILAKEANLLKSSEQLQAELKFQYSNLEKKAATQIEMFETKVKQHLCRHGLTKLNLDIDKLLLIMNKHRQEVNKVRFALLLQQHSEAQLKYLIDKMENLGNGLTIKSFTTLEANNQTLDKKIEERNNDLSKFYLRCQNNIHTMAHCKENQKILQESIEIQQKALNNLTDQKLALREQLFSLKLERNRIHGKIKKLSTQSGLLDKPALMYDYDNTVELLGKKKEEVNYLRQFLFKIQRKIDKILENCSNKQIA